MLGFDLDSKFIGVATSKRHCLWNMELVAEAQLAVCSFVCCEIWIMTRGIRFRLVILFALLISATEAAAQSYSGGQDDPRLKQTPACRQAAGSDAPGAWGHGSIVGCCQYGVADACRGYSNYGIGCCKMPPR